MFKIIIILLIIIPSITSYAYDRNCSRIMDEPFKEYQEEAKDEHSAFYVVVSNDHGCELDLKKSAFLEPTVKEFQLPPRAKSCRRAIWQEKYNHERSLDCLARLNF